jgi:hypothetical protein
MPFGFPDFYSGDSIQVECVFVKFSDYANKANYHNNLRQFRSCSLALAPRLNPRQTPCWLTHLIGYGLGTLGTRRQAPRHLFLRFRGRIVPAAANHGLLH